MLPLPDSTILLPIFGYKTIRANHIFYDIFIVAEMITGNFHKSNWNYHVSFLVFGKYYVFAQFSSFAVILVVWMQIMFVRIRLFVFLLHSNVEQLQNARTCHLHIQQEKLHASCIQRIE